MVWPGGENALYWTFSTKKQNLLSGQNSFRNSTKPIQADETIFTNSPNNKTDFIHVCYKCNMRLPFSESDAQITKAVFYNFSKLLPFFTNGLSDFSFPP